MNITASTNCRSPGRCRHERAERRWWADQERGRSASLQRHPRPLWRTGGCLLQDGKLGVRVQEERFTRVKNDRPFPRNAFRFCLEQGGIGIDEVDGVSLYEDPSTNSAGSSRWA